MSPSTHARRHRLSASVAAVLSATLPMAAASAQTTRTENLTIDDHRPLDHAAHELTVRYGLTVTYEDPPWMALSDLVDVSKDFAVGDEVAPGDLEPLLAPAPGRLSLEFEVDTVTGLPVDPLGLVLDLVAGHHFADNPGRFRVEQVGSTLHIIPTAVTNLSGDLAPVVPVMDRLINLELKEQSGLEALDALRDALAAAADRPVLLGGAPLSLRGVTVSVDVKSAPARQVMADFVGQLGAPTTWSLCFDPVLDSYLLIVSPVLRGRPLEPPGVPPS